MENQRKNINLVVGAGISGAVIARKTAEQLNEKVLVIDRKNHIGGNCFDYINSEGICVHKYGSHIFHTNSDAVWKFLNKFCSFNTYMHKVYALIDGIETTIPFNLNTLYEVLPKSLALKLEIKLLNHFKYNSRVPILEFKKQNDKDLNFLAEYIYEKVFLNYTKKQWGKEPETVDCAVTARVPVLISKDNRYFQDKYQGIPQGGYTNMIKNMLSHPNIEILLDTDFNDLPSCNYKRIFYTGSIDEFYGYKFGKLPYRSVKFKFEEHDVKFYQKNSVINYPNNYDFTRIHEYKYYLNDDCPTTLIAKEYSEDFIEGKNERYYPVVNDRTLELYQKYLALSYDKGIYFLGRLGDYKYYDMDKAVLRAIELFNAITKNDRIKITAHQGGINGV